MATKPQITELTEAQKALQLVYRDKWIEIGLSTTPASRMASEAAICDAYEIAGLERPPLFVWEPDPFHGALTVMRLWQEATGEVLKEAPMPCYGLHDAAWLAYYDYTGEVLGVAECDRLKPLQEVAKTTGWWWPYDTVCVVTPKPSAIHRDAAGRLHCENGPALDYTGHWGVWAWHGTRVTRRIIEQPETITANEILTEPNAEIARIMLERMGEEKFFLQSKPTILHADVDGAGQPRRLLSVDTPNDPEGKIVVCEVICPSTGHRALLRVEANITRCDVAIAWTWGMTLDEYHPIQET